MDLSDIQGLKYPNKLEMPKITKHEILQTMRYLRTKKVPRPDLIPNAILKIIACKICSFLGQIFNDSFALGDYPSHFKESIVIILHKISGNQDYISPKNYQPISLLNILDKIIEAILATRINYLATTYKPLTKTHFGG